MNQQDIINKLKEIPGLDNINILAEKDKKKILTLEDSNNLGVRECLKRPLTLIVTHNSQFRSPAEEIVRNKNGKIIFPAVKFNEINNTISSSPSIKVHNYLVNRFNLKLKDEATLLIGI